jgi:hypothetical protein
MNPIEPITLLLIVHLPLYFNVDLYNPEQI